MVPRREDGVLVIGVNVVPRGLTHHLLGTPTEQFAHRLRDPLESPIVVADHDHVRAVLGEQPVPGLGFDQGLATGVRRLGAANTADVANRHAALALHGATPEGDPLVVVTGVEDSGFGRQTFVSLRTVDGREYGGDVVGVDQVADGLADDLIGRGAQQLLDRRGHPLGDEVGAGLEHDVGGVLREEPVVQLGLHECLAILVVGLVVAHAPDEADRGAALVGNRSTPDRDPAKLSAGVANPDLGGVSLVGSGHFDDPVQTFQVIGMHEANHGLADQLTRLQVEQLLDRRRDPFNDEVGTGLEHDVGRVLREQPVARQGALPVGDVAPAVAEEVPQLDGSNVVVPVEAGGGVRVGEAVE